ncbi:SCO family protein [Streptomyces sp. NBC_00448]|uniref:SCO family protein n=1 Tax=Streptomyces sp. NBC_00448 TaxID=2903652 RepID=UPI002E24F745
MRHHRPTAAAVALAAVCALAGCSGSSDSGPVAKISTPPSSSTHGAIVFDTPFPKPALDLTDQDGKRYDLVRRTAGRPLLLYFGYTHCPDVCPTTMADLAGAVQRLPTGSPRPTVVFVTTDPQRDTPGRLKQWLREFDPHFVGLTGDFGTIQRAARGLGIGVSAPVRNADGSESVTHGAEVVVFSPKDDKAHLLYPSGTPESRFAADLPRLVQGATP